MRIDQIEPSFEGDAPAAAEPDALPDRRELALVAVERTRMPMVVTDPRQPDNPIVLANQAFLDLTGYNAEEVIGRNCRFLQGQGTAQADVERIRQGLAATGDHIEVELLNYRKDGSAFWNQLAISPVHAADGELLYYFASQKDVTARRRAGELEATERLLLMEVDHRAMNALALVQSIVRLSRSDNVGSYSASVLGRVDALARAHRLLAKANWSGADLSELVAMETPSSAASRVKAQGAAAAIPAKLVQPVTLVLHELISNAVQHGALASPSGTIIVDWTATGDSACLTLKWREAGANVRPDEPTSGFGLTMIKGVIERQLGGSFGPQWRSDGLEAKLEFLCA
jgi:PAS domain S-box-containing protein